MSLRVALHMQLYSTAGEVESTFRKVARRCHSDKTDNLQVHEFYHTMDMLMGMWVKGQAMDIDSGWI